MNIKKFSAHVASKLLRMAHLDHCVPDKAYISLSFMMRLGEKMHWNNPQTFSEKLQWMKLYYRNPLLPKLVDKVAVKEYVAQKIGMQYVIPTIMGGANWHDPDEIDFDSLPDQFVLKCNHDSGSACICKDKAHFDREAAKQKLRQAMKRNYYWAGREWAYRQVTPCIFAEKYMEDESHRELKDYKVFCFGGKPYFIQVDFNRFAGHKRKIYDPDWIDIDIALGFPTDPSVHIEKPEKLDEMLRLAEKLSEGFPFVRVDFYSIYDKLYFGEMTFYPGGGQEIFKPKEWDARLGELIQLPK